MVQLLWSNTNTYTCVQRSERTIIGGGFRNEIRRRETTDLLLLPLSSFFFFLMNEENTQYGSCIHSLITATWLSLNQQKRRWVRCTRRTAILTKKGGFVPRITLFLSSQFSFFFFFKRSTHKNKSSPFYHSGSEVCTKGSSVANKNIKQQQRRRRHLLTN